jgi:[glutamine synthetase] adenylyltransferase / [glutamine synthetase]-adenylyl-L-tyrosine phosphorylase
VRQNTQKKNLTLSPKLINNKAKQAFKKLYPNFNKNLEDDLILSNLAYCLGLSDYFSQILFKYPDIKKDILDWISIGLKGKFDKHDKCFVDKSLNEKLSKKLNKITKKIKSSQDNLEDNIGGLLSLFREFRHDVMTKILVSDFLGFCDCAKTIKRLSSLADVCLLKSLSILQKIYKQDFLILCMGKLGCGELNFSSDIDLIFCVTDNSFDIKKAMPMAQKIIQILNQNTVDSFVFRVDVRLRPFGGAGALVLSEKQFLDYLTKDARSWERYVMMKARVLTLDPKNSLNLQKGIDHFVYRPYRDFTVNDTIIEMKSRIEHKLLVEDKEDDFKSGAGGIRDIEFICQTFQLIYGGERTYFRQIGVLDVLEKIYLEKFISLEQKEGLLKAYVFLRDAENHLQMINNQQIHACPKDDMMQLRLAASMGYTDWKDFLVQLRAQQEFVKACFDDLIKPELSLKDPGFVAIDVPADEAVDLSKKSLKDNISKNIFNQIIATKSRYKSMDKLQQRQVQRIYVYYSQCIGANLKEDERKLAYERMAHLLCSIIARPTYISLLLSSKNMIENLALLLPKSSWVYNALKKMPYLIAFMVSNEKIQPLSFDEQGKDDEIYNERLRHFKWSSMAKIACDVLRENITIDRASILLTELAEVILFEVYKRCWDDLVAKSGKPSGVKNFRSTGFAIIAYGKLASSELLFSSDLDLVFLYKDQAEPKSDSNHKFYAKLAQKILSFLQTKTLSGFLYPIDIRLRPSGGSGLLVSKIEAFEKYQQKNAWVWEHQALMRSRAILGDAILIKKFDKIRSDILCKVRVKKDLIDQVNNMRNKIKQEKVKARSPSYHIDKIKYDKGGLNDIEFLVQYFVLLKSSENKKLVKLINTLDLLNILCKLGFLDKDQLKLLASAYNYYRDYIYNTNLIYGDFEGKYENLNTIKFTDALLEHFSNVSKVFDDLV